MPSVSVTLQPPPIPQTDYFEGKIEAKNFILVNNFIKNESDKVIKATCFYVLSVRGEGPNAVLTLQYVSDSKRIFKVALKSFRHEKIPIVAELRITKSIFESQLGRLSRVYNETNEPSKSTDDYKEITRLKLGLNKKKEQMAKLNTERAEAERKLASAEKEAANKQKKAEKAKRKSEKAKKKNCKIRGKNNKKRNKN